MVAVFWVVQLRLRKHSEFFVVRVIMREGGGRRAVCSHDNVSMAYSKRSFSSLIIKTISTHKRLEGSGTGSKRRTAVTPVRI